MNAKKELLDKIRQISCLGDGTKIICATISIDIYNRLDEALNEEELKPYILKQGYNNDDYMTFINSLDFEYDNGYGSQELFGTVWFTNSIWMDRYEYDGSEYWDIHKYPDILMNCLNIHHIHEKVC